MSIILPVFYITSFSCASFYVPPSESAMASMLNVTLMLVLTVATYIKHISDTVPNVSYQTLPDTYSTMSMIVLAAVVVQNCIVGPLGSPKVEKARFTIETASPLITVLKLFGPAPAETIGAEADLAGSDDEIQAVGEEEVEAWLQDFLLLQHASFNLFWIGWGSFNVIFLVRAYFLNQLATLYMADRPTSHYGNGIVARDHRGRIMLRTSKPRTFRSSAVGVLMTLFSSTQSRYRRALRELTATRIQAIARGLTIRKEMSIQKWLVDYSRAERTPRTPRKIQQDQKALV